MNASIIFEILFELLNNGRVSRAELADKLEISARSISRYINNLMLSGIPVITYNGPGGGYGLPDDFILERSFLTKEERGRVIHSLNATKSAYDDSLNNSLIQKFSAFTKGDTSNFMFKSETLIIDAGAWNNPQTYRSKIHVLSGAIEKCRTVSFHYIDRHEYASSRKFDPHCIVLKEGIWYVYGYCHMRENFRMFKLARINNLSVTAEPFTRKPFDIYSKLSGQFDDTDLVKFTVEFSNLILPEIEEWLGLEAISERGTQYVATAELYGGNVLTAKILSFGSSVKVLSPPALKEEILLECKRILNNA